MQLTCPFLDDPLDVLGRNRVLVVVGSRGDIGCVHGNCGLDLGLRLAHLVEEHLKDERIHDFEEFISQNHNTNQILELDLP